MTHLYVAVSSKTAAFLSSLDFTPMVPCSNLYRGQMPIGLCFVVVLNPSKQILGFNTEVGHSKFLFNSPYKFIISVHS